MASGKDLFKRDLNLGGVLFEFSHLLIIHYLNVSTLASLKRLCYPQLK